MDSILFDHLLVLMRAVAGTPAVSATISSTLLPASVFALLQKHRQGTFRVDAAGGQRPGFGRQQTDADCPLF
jgi:hypothetical protein